jgi:hypothetical protein
MARDRVPAQKEVRRMSGDAIETSTLPAALPDCDADEGLGTTDVLGRVDRSTGSTVDRTIAVIHTTRRAKLHVAAMRSATIPAP